jgi:diguanylate cyclase (GGDEF)-like protein
MIEQYKYRNELLRKYLLIGFVSSLFLAPIYYRLHLMQLTVTLNFFSVGTVYLFYNSKTPLKYIFNSRFFMCMITILFFIGFISGNQKIDSTFFVLLYPIASFSIRGAKEGIFWSVMLLGSFIALFNLLSLQYNFYSFLFFCVAYFMIAYLLYYYRYYEMKNFQYINEQLENTIKIRTKELYISNQRLKELAVTDSLTQLYNRFKLDGSLKNEIDRTNRFSHLFGIIILDIDHFKMTNDTYGHNVGDTVLQEFASILKNNTRKTDIVGRWGGEEFLIICPEIDEKGLVKLAENLRTQIEEHDFLEVGSKTASFGLTMYREKDTSQTIVARADEALYRAKANGRNRIETTFL